MRPILALAILLLGLNAAFPGIKLGIELTFGTSSEQQNQEAKAGDQESNKESDKASNREAKADYQQAKLQDRVPAADEDPSSAGIQLASADGDFALSETEIRQAGIAYSPISDFAVSPTAIRKTDRVLAMVTPASIEASETSHDQGEAGMEPQLPAPATTVAAEAASIDSLCNALLTSAQDNDLPVPFFANLIWQESRLQSDSISRAGAAGIAQFMPDAANEVGLDDPFDPQQAIPASARLLRELRDQFGNLGYVAAAYNAGPGRVGQWLHRRHAGLPRETRTYVLRVTGRTAEAWRKAPPADSMLRFAPSLPCRSLPAFAELEAQLKDAPPYDDNEARPPRERVASRVAHLIARKIAARAAARVVARSAATATVRIAAAKAAAPAASGAASSGPSATGGSVALPVALDSKPAAKPAATASNMMARNVHVRRAALRHAQPVPHDKRRVA
jgi:soluble lytic murein transglycosylase-like protein